MREQKWDNRLQAAVQHFWNTRLGQYTKQGSATGQRDSGERAAVTGGKQMDGFIGLVRDILVDTGVPDEAIHFHRKLELPGYYRAEKQWDIVVVVKQHLLLAVECKSQVGPSFANNFNNRTEEALGTATDLWTAYREGAFQLSHRPWLGYLLLLEDCPRSTAPVKPAEPHFEVFPEFKDASYAQRYMQLLSKLLRERLYDGACFIMSGKEEGTKGKYREIHSDLTFHNFAIGMRSKIEGDLRRLRI